MEELPWSDVVKVHGTVAGIATKSGKAVSLLCNQSKSGSYPDKVEGDELTYYVGRGTQGHGIKALFRLVEEPEPIRVFEKLGVNRWVDLGRWEPAGLGDQTSKGEIPVHFRRVR